MNTGKTDSSKLPVSISIANKKQRFSITVISVNAYFI